MRKTFTKIILAFAGMTGVLSAQQDPQFTQFMYNKLIYNPGYAGTSNAICATAVYRQQWVNFPGAPKTGMISVDMPIGTLPIGIGLNVMQDQIGFDKTLNARLAVSYLFRNLGGPGTLGIGIDGGILQKQFNGDWIPPQTMVDPNIPSINNNPNLNRMTYDLSFGAYYTIPNKLYVGISSTHLTAQDVKESSSINFAMARHYYIMAGYTHVLSGPHAIQPNIKIKTDASSTQLDINLTYLYDNYIWAGVSYRLQDAIAPMLGMKLLKDRSLKVGYSYDVTTSKIKGYSSGTHEIMVGYCFNVKTKTKVTSYQNVRFLN